MNENSANPARPAAAIAQQNWTVGAVRELRERAIEADRAAGRVVDRGLDHAVGDQREHECTREVAKRSKRGEATPHRLAHP